jgi:hypothetical protein
MGEPCSKGPAFLTSGYSNRSFHSNFFTMTVKKKTDEHGPGPGHGPVRTSVISGWYFTDGSPTAGAAGSLPPTYATQKERWASANLQ